jgi:Domain of unknown function (DUF6458)
MGIGVSIFLIAVGAVLAFAVDAEVSGLDIQVVGWILLVVGAVGILLSLLFWSSWGGWGRRREVVEERPASRRETVVRDDV